MRGRRAADAIALPAQADREIRMIAEIEVEEIAAVFPQEAVEEGLHALADPIRVVLRPAEIDGVVPVADIAEPAVLDDAGAQIPAVVEDEERTRRIAPVRPELEDAPAVVQVAAELGVALLPLLAGAAGFALAARLVVEPAD